VEACHLNQIKILLVLSTPVSIVSEMVYLPCFDGSDNITYTWMIRLVIVDINID
jgi:hypothetical protein